MEEYNNENTLKNDNISENDEVSADLMPKAIPID